MTRHLVKPALKPKGIGSQRVNCYVCGHPLRRSPSKVRPRNYCDLKCRDADVDKPRKQRSDTGSRKAPRVKANCPICGKEVERRLSDVRENIYCSRDCANAAHRGVGRPKPKPGDTRPVRDGYVQEYRVGGWEQQHRIVMEGILGRALLPGENVHHINGVRKDNRPENLELWVTSQPSGQRPADLVAWAHEILALYEESAA